jgi:hypothetical protein
MLERITGPFHDQYYVAARARRLGPGWLGEARVFQRRPGSFDDDDSLAKLGGDLGNATSELDGVQNAERVARDWIGARVAAARGDSP